MTGINEMTFEDAMHVKEIIAYKKVDDAKVAGMQNFAIKYIDSGIRICFTCPSQIRFTHKRIVDWHNRFEEQINLIIYKHTHQEQEVTNKVATDELNSCEECGKQLYDKRKKYCSKTCKDIVKKK